MFMLLLAMGNVPGSLAPRVSDVQVESTEAGVCTNSTVTTPAAFRVSWTITNPNAADYEIRIYENSVFKETLDGDVVQWDRTVSGVIENGPRNSFLKSYQYDVEIARISDGQVVSTARGSISQRYGTCGPREGGVKTPV